MTRDTRTQIIAGLVCLFCLVGSGTLAVGLSSTASRAKLAYTDRVEEGQPWEVSAGIAMGAFRGIFVNMLWIRANDLKESGKFYEAIQLSDAITRLQPRFTRVWVFHAWNMSYNISVSTQTREERWRWVNAGIRLLRDKAIPANPNDMLLHKELGWIYLHKIGGFTDDSNNYYKQQLAREWTVLVGPPPARAAEDRDRAVVTEKYVKWIEPIATAPDTFEELVATTPTVRDLAERIKGAGVKTDDGLLKRYEMWRALSRSGQRYLWERELGPTMTAFGAIVDDKEMAEEWDALIPYVRRRMIIDVYHMDPASMVSYTQELGPIDWRHYAAHSLYWAHRGVDAGLLRVSDATRRDYDFINTDRVLMQSIQELFRTGDLYFDYLSSTIEGREAMLQGLPNPHFVETYSQIMDPMRKRAGDMDDAAAKGTSPLSAGFENFLRDAITFFYARGDKQNAEKWQDRFLNYVEHTMNDPQRRIRLTNSLDDFVEAELVGNLTRPSIMITQVNAALQGAFASGLLGGDSELFQSQLEYAKKVHRIFMDAQLRFTSSDTVRFRMESMPRDFRVAAGLQFAQFIPQLSLDDAEIVYDRAPDDLKGFAYDILASTVKPEMEMFVKENPDAKVMRSFEAMFPEPKSLAEVRHMISEYMKDRSGTRLDLEQQ